MSPSRWLLEIMSARALRFSLGSGIRCQLSVVSAGQKLDGVDDDVAVGVCVGNCDGGFGIEPEFPERVKRFVTRRCNALVERGLSFTADMANRDGHIGRAVGVGGITNANFVDAGLPNCESVGGGQLAFLLVVVVQVHGADVAADGGAGGPLADLFGGVIVDDETGQ